MDAKTTEAVELLRRLIATPSTSRDESRTADLLFAFLEERGAAPERLHNNVFARSADFDPARPTLLLNSHHDTVRPAASYTRDPFAPTAEGDRLYGLGSNDAGASVVSLARTFLTFREQSLPFNLLLALSAEEECMGENGIRALLPAPTFAEYAAALESVGCEVKRKTLHEADDFAVTEAFVQAVDQSIDLVFLCQPNNPTGQITPPELVQRLVRRCADNARWQRCALPGRQARRWNCPARPRPKPGGWSR